MPFKQKFSILVVLIILVSLSIAAFMSYNYEGRRVPSPSPIARPTPGQVRSATIQENNETFLVTRIVDGDTFVISTKQKVRLIGVNTPELHVATTKIPDCFGIEAKQKLSELIMGKSVALVKDISETDRYGRLLRYVYIGDDFINKDLVEQGYAQVDTFPPDVNHKSDFLIAQKVARENNRGLWSSCK